MGLGLVVFILSSVGIAIGELVLRGPTISMVAEKPIDAGFIHPFSHNESQTRSSAPYVLEDLTVSGALYFLGSQVPKTPFYNGSLDILHVPTGPWCPRVVYVASWLKCPRRNSGAFTVCQSSHVTQSKAYPSLSVKVAEQFVLRLTQASSFYSGVYVVRVWVGPESLPNEFPLTFVIAPHTHVGRVHPFMCDAAILRRPAKDADIYTLPHPQPPTPSVHPQLTTTPTPPTTQTTPTTAHAPPHTPAPPSPPTPAPPAPSTPSPEAPTTEAIKSSTTAPQSTTTELASSVASPDIPKTLPGSEGNETSYAAVSSNQTGSINNRSSRSSRYQLSTTQIVQIAIPAAILFCVITGSFVCCVRRCYRRYGCSRKQIYRPSLHVGVSAANEAALARLESELTANTPPTPPGGKRRLSRTRLPSLTSIIEESEPPSVRSLSQSPQRKPNTSANSNQPPHPTKIIEMTSFT
ncbi:envelope glycoprotein I [Pteropodid alphaherpesvirus 1]|uniref:Envelope glycoprotein I n=1 Tax=Pteropodid alphaherpesvirus 1 TaxID=1343901 RepID=A0A060Q0X8_9ALPH|nr:envelope glycoprotein I [Pteropodid alphaherpesvirus 1]BAP00744.1 envelope glycoprotein I [Pteropodid alphaherpesvirus 1]